MSLDRLLDQLGLRPQDPDNLEAKLHAMRRDVRKMTAALSHHLAQEGEELTGQARAFGTRAAQQSKHLTRVAGSQALAGASHLRRDPLPAIALIGTGLLIARLLKRQ